MASASSSGCGMCRLRISAGSNGGGGGEAGYLSGIYGLYLMNAIVVFLSCGWRDAIERLKQSVIVEPIDPLSAAAPRHERSSRGRAGE